MILHNFHFSNFDAFGYQAEETVHSVHLDRKQRLWIGSEKGLHLFDGTRVTTFEGKEDSPEDIPHYFAKAITETPQGDIWIGTWGGGITRFNEVSRSFFKPDLTKAGQSHTGFDQKVWSLESDEKGRIWIGSFTTGLFRYSPDADQIINAYAAAPGEVQQYNRIQAIHADKKGRIWFAPSGKPVRVIDADTLELEFEIKPPPELDTHPRLRTVDDIAPVPGSNHVMIAYDRGLVRIVSSEGDVVHEFKLDRMPPESSIMEALPLSDSAALIGSGSQLWYLNLESGDHFAIPNGEWKGAIPKTIIWDMDLSDTGDILIAGTTGVWIQPYSSRQFWTIFQGGEEPSKLHEARAISRIRDSLYVNNGSDIFEIPNFPKGLDRPKKLESFRRVSDPDTRALSLIGKEGWGFWGASDEESFYLDHNYKLQPITPSLRATHTMLLDEEFRPFSGR
ncbi:MAG: two-component regulator propeller domain-containing protein [Xanthomonadales bacterium]|nr:two-component regulator propeller domain-containing protein [Xanthomonadales bacterium]